MMSMAASNRRGLQPSCPQALASGERADDLPRITIPESKVRADSVSLFFGKFGIHPANVVENAVSPIEQPDMLVEHRNAPFCAPYGAGDGGEQACRNL